MKAFELNEDEGGMNKLQTKEKTLKIQTARTQHVSSRCTNAASRNGACPCRQLPQKGKKAAYPRLLQNTNAASFCLVSPRKAFIFLSLHLGASREPSTKRDRGGESFPLTKWPSGAPPGTAPHAAVGLWAPAPAHSKINVPIQPLSPRYCLSRIFSLRFPNIKGLFVLNTVTGSAQGAMWYLVSLQYMFL